LNGLGNLNVVAELRFAPEQRIIEQVEVVGREEALQVNRVTWIGHVYLAA